MRAGLATSTAVVRSKASVSKEHRAFKASKVLAERHQAVVAVGAWVESGQDFVEHPCVLASLTEELQAERRRENEESLRRFQDEVRHRVAQISKQNLQTTDVVVKPVRRIPQQHHVRTQRVCGGEKLRSVSRQKTSHMAESSEGMRQVRLRLAACRMIPHGEMPSDLPGGRWNISPTRHRAESHVLRREEEEEEEEGNSLLFTNQHECPLVQHNTTEQHSRASGHVWDADRPQPDPGLKSTHRVPQILWSLADEDKLKRQRQSQFLMSRRHFMNTEREQVKENNQHRKHLRRTARIKAEKEQIRQEEERKMERARQLAEARQKLEERELLILQRLKLDEDERTAELERRKRQEKGREAARYIGALRARVKERLSQGKQDLPPLCCCASSFWDSHPDTCANNCVFHNNPKAYALALQSALKGLDLQ